MPSRSIGRAGLLAALLLAAGCTSTVAPPPRARVGEPRPAPLPKQGLERVLGQDARALTALFGPPDQDQREDAARRLQFVSGVCVLDTYLYPPKGGGEPIVTWIDARTPQGADIDRASCVAALARRR